MYVCPHFCATPLDKSATLLINEIFQGDYVAIGASGGKDSTVLAYIMKTLHDRYDYGLKLVLLSIDEGITGMAYNKASLFFWQICFTNYTHGKFVFLSQATGTTHWRR